MRQHISIVDKFSLENFKCSRTININAKSKNRKDRSLFTLLLCPEPGSLSAFETYLDLQSHIDSRTHDFSSNKTSMDCVKTYFADLLQTSSHQNVSVKNDAKVIEKRDDCPLLERFCSPGSALPKRQVVQFSLGQRIFLYNEFIIGEESGRKIIVLQHMS